MLIVGIYKTPCRSSLTLSIAYLIYSHERAVQTKQQTVDECQTDNEQEEECESQLDRHTDKEDYRWI